MEIISSANLTRASLSFDDSKEGNNSLMRMRFEIDSEHSLLHIVNLRIFSLLLIKGVIPSLKFRSTEEELLLN